MDDRLSDGKLLFVPPNEKNSRAIDGVVSALQYTVIIILIAIAAFYYTVSYNAVDGESMQKTLEEGQCVALQRHLYNIDYNDIVTFDVGDSEDHYLIKRIIALGGDRVLFVRQSNNMYVDLYICKNGKTSFELVEEQYIKEKMALSASYEKTPIVQYIDGKTLESIDVTVESSDVVTESIRQKLLKNCFTVRKDHFFFLGDNRNHSNDSRHYGDLPLSSVYGKMISDLDGSGPIDGLIRFAFGLG